MATFSSGGMRLFCFATEFRIYLPVIQKLSLSNLDPYTVQTYAAGSTLEKDYQLL
jgi:hypothetical protein